MRFAANCALQLLAFGFWRPFPKAEADRASAAQTCLKTILKPYCRPARAIKFNLLNPLHEFLTHESLDEIDCSPR
jgi:hypothetical protein